ncbi:ACSM4, partial [Cordylochernes scorpioides]
MKILMLVNHAKRLCRTNNLYKWTPSRSNSVHFLDKYYDSEGILRAPKYFNFAHDVVDRWAKLEQAGERDSHLPALWFVKQDGKETKLNFSEISDMSKRAANFLEKECQLGRGDRIILILPLMLEWWFFQLGASRIGAIVSSGTIQLSPKDIEYRAIQLEATCIVTDNNNAHKIDQVDAKVPTLRNKVLIDPTTAVERRGWIHFNKMITKYSSKHECALTKSNDTFVIYFTSGTTGNPKMVEHTQCSQGLGVLNDSKYFLEAKPGEIIYCTSDPGWGKSVYIMLYCAWIGGAGVFAYQMPRFDSHLLLNVLRKYSITTLMTVPTTYRMLIQSYPNEPLNISSTIKDCITGGEPIDEQIQEKWEDSTGIKIREVYGQSEMATFCNMRNSIPYKRGSMGKPFPGVDIVILDEDLHEVKPTEHGQIALRIDRHRPLNLFKGYYKNPSKTAEVFQGSYYLTGDRGYVDQDGYVWFLSRNDDVISSAGYRIGPSEVEEAINTHPAVAESAAVSSPDLERGEVVKAFVVLRPEYKEQPQDLVKQLQDHVKSLTAPYKYPRKFKRQYPHSVWPEKQSAKLDHVLFNMLLRLVRTLVRTPRSPSARYCSSIANLFLDSNGLVKKPKCYNFAQDVIDHWATLESNGSKIFPYPALWFVSLKGDEVKWNFSTISNLSRKAANFFVKECGLGKKDRFVVILPQTPEWWIVKLAISRLGAIYSPASIQLSPGDIAYRLVQLEATCIITDIETSKKVDQITTQCPSLKHKILIDPTESINLPGWINFNMNYHSASTDHKCEITGSDETFNVYFTSGTTGHPKMVEHTHASIGLSLLVDCNSMFQCSDEHLMWCNADLGWGKAAHLRFYIPWLSGAGVFVHEQSRFDPSFTLQILKDYPISVYSAVPTTYRKLIVTSKEKIQLNPNFKKFLGGGESVPYKLITRWKEITGYHIIEMYSQTEAFSMGCLVDEKDYKPGSLGKAAKDLTIKIIDNNGRPAHPGEEGEIAIKLKPERPLKLFKGYLNNPEKTDAVLRGDYYFTGDRGYMNEEGYIWFVGRSDDIISSSGYKIGPVEVEDALHTHPAVAESAVVSSPDPERGEVVKAFVVLKPDLGSIPDGLVQELQEHVKSQTAPYKYPRRVEFVDSLPKTITGKINRRVLKQEEWNKVRNF